MRRLIVGAVVVAAYSTALAGPPMTVKVVPPTSLVKVTTRDPSWDIFLDGEIDADAAKRFTAAAASLNGEPATVHLNSPGGNLLGGLALGSAIRKARYSTDVGRSAPNGKVNGAENTAPGICMSACTFAFLGGIYRGVGTGSQYGVHRVSAPSTSPNDLDVGQVITARVAQYVHDMGADEGLVGLYTSVPADAIHVLTAGELTSLRVVNNGKEPADWSVQFTDAGPYVRGMQQTMFGLGKAIFYCAEGKVIFHSIYSTEFAPVISRREWFHSLIVNESEVPLEPEEIVNDHGFVNTMVALTSQQALSLTTATTIGHAMQMARGAPTFVGYRIDVDQPARKQIGGFVKNCLSQSVPTSAVAH
jgi:hypothetical protein